MRYLLNSDKAISSEVLASILGTTSKTIRGVSSKNKESLVFSLQ